MRLFYLDDGRGAMPAEPELAPEPRPLTDAGGIEISAGSPVG
jgi:hypothetical protein